MNRTVRRRHLLFFSTSLVIHILFVVTLVGVLFIVSDAPSTDSARPLVVSLNRGEEGGLAPDREEPRKRDVTPVKKSIPPEASGPNVREGEQHPDDTVGEGDSAGLSGSVGEGSGEDAAALGDYIRAVRARIERHKRYPPAAVRDNLEGTVIVSFLLDRHGTLRDKRIAVGSGSSVLDEAALAAVAESSPFPPFPDGLDRETLLLRLPINYRAR
jgi:protein TonB